jgi:protocatechuate 3,4-dioxygenase beta subunit
MNPRLAAVLAILALPPPAAAQSAQAPHDAPTSIVLAPSSEPGTPLRIRGAVIGPDGAPVARASIYVYQTDAAGIYNPSKPRDSDHPRLNGYLRTDARGRFSYTTVRPGSYPGTRNPGHIHYHVNAPGFAEQVFEIVFAGDSLIPEQWRRDAANPLAGVVIVPLTAGADGGLAGEHTVAMRPARSVSGRNR